MQPYVNEHGAASARPASNDAGPTGHATPFPTYDLRSFRPDEALTRLEYLNDRWRRDGRRFGLWATVERVDKVKGDPDSVRWHLECGVRWRANNNAQLRPTTKVSRSQPRPDRPVIVVPASRDAIMVAREPAATDDSVTYRIFPAEVGAANLGRPVCGRLRSSRNEHGRRVWRACVTDDTSYPVPRSELTADLGSLFDLDTLPDEHPTLRRLAEEEVRLAATGDGTTLSVVAAPTRASREDLLVSVQAGQVGHLTFIRRDADTLVLEVARRGGATAEHPDAPPLLGVLASLSEDALFDERGRPVDAPRLVPG